MSQTIKDEFHYFILSFLGFRYIAALSPYRPAGPASAAHDMLRYVPFLASARRLFQYLRRWPSHQRGNRITDALYTRMPLGYWRLLVLILKRSPPIPSLMPVISPRRRRRSMTAATLDTLATRPPIDGGNFELPVIDSQSLMIGGEASTAPPSEPPPPSEYATLPEQLSPRSI